MSNATKLMRLVPSVVGQWQSPTTCYRCGREFKRGELVYSRAKKAGHLKRYHKKCWESLYN